MFQLNTLKISRRRHCESTVYKGLMIEDVVSINCLIFFHCEISSGCINKGEHHANTRALFTIIEKDFHVINLITVQLKDQIYIIKQCDVCSNNKYGTINDEN